MKTVSNKRHDSAKLRFLWESVRLRGPVDTTLQRMDSALTQFHRTLSPCIVSYPIAVLYHTLLHRTLSPCIVRVLSLSTTTFLLPVMYFTLTQLHRTLLPCIVPCPVAVHYHFLATCYVLHADSVTQNIVALYRAVSCRCPLPLSCYLLYFTLTQLHRTLSPCIVPCPVAVHYLLATCYVLHADSVTQNIVALYRAVSCRCLLPLLLPVMYFTLTQLHRTLSPCIVPCPVAVHYHFLATRYVLHADSVTQNIVALYLAVYCRRLLPLSCYLYVLHADSVTQNTVSLYRAVSCRCLLPLSCYLLCTSR
ncbi:hypothetical protein J6590_003943 [Homalodisca vitripennis]|nr:hypothetical protein J6590_003943 [Homalodisca vitripennis]